MENKNIFSPKSIMSDSQTYHKYKKGGTNYKKNKESAKPETQAEKIANLKTKMTDLALELLQKKAINKPLHKKIQKYATGRTRLNTLQDTLNTLKEIDYNVRHDIKSPNADKRTMDYKQFTIKELKAMKKVDAGDFIVYRKFRVYTESAALKVNEKVLTEAETLALCDISERNITSTIKGRHHIMDQIQEDINYFLSYPYIIKVEVVKVMISDDNVDAKTYRWEGAIKEFAQGKYQNDNPYIYDKAWQMVFEYKAYNFDPNNETPLECVPNALFKMYGDKSKGKDMFVSAIANGGMEYVKEQLDIGGFSSELDIEPQKRDGKNGYSPLDILNFCNDHKIRCFGYDWMMKQFMTNNNVNINFYSVKVPAFVFYFNDNHIYLLNDKATRHALLQGNKTAEVSQLVREKKKAKFEREYLIDVAVEDWNKHEKSNIYITEDRLVHNTFYKSACAGVVYNVGIRMSEKEGIVSFQHNNKNTIIYNPDVVAVLETIKKLNPSGESLEVIDDEEAKPTNDNPYYFKNQRIHTLAREYLDKEFGGVPLSTMNSTGDYVFHSEFIRHHAFNGWMSKPENMENLTAYDYNKHYSSCFMG